MIGAYLSPRARESESVPRSPSPSPSAKPLSPHVTDTTNVASMMDSNDIGQGWEISFDEEDLDLQMVDNDMSVSVPCRYSKDQDGPDGLSLYDITEEVMLEDETNDHRRYSNLSTHDDIGHSSGSASGSIHTPSTVHTAIISILPPTTASTANFPLDIFPSPPKSFTDLEHGPLRSRPSSPEFTLNSNRLHGPGPQIRYQRQHRRRFSEPTRCREAVVAEQRRFTMSYELVPHSFGATSCQERIIRVGFPQKRRSSIGSVSLGLSLGSKFGGDTHVRGLARGRGDARKECRGQSVEEMVKPKLPEIQRKEGNAQMCVYDGVDEALEESTSAPSLSSASRREASNEVTMTTLDAPLPLWPSLPSGPSSPNFTSFTCQQDTLPRGRVLSGFSDINYSLCSFSVDGHGEDEPGLGIKGDISPTIPIISLRPDSGDITVGISSRQRPFTRPRPAPLPLALSLGPLPPIPSAAGGSTASSSGFTQTIASLESSATTANIVQPDTRIHSQRGLIENADSPSVSVNHQGQNGSKQLETSIKPYPLQISTLPSSRNFPLVEIDNIPTPSNGKQHPSTRSKGIPSTVEDPGVLPLVISSTEDISVHTLASPISIYSQHTLPPSPKSQDSMPLSLSRSHQDWDQSESFNAPLHPYHQPKATPGSRNGFTPSSEKIVTPPDSGFTSPPPSYTHFTGNLRRVSKFSGSSNASSYSSETSSLRHEKGVYSTAERPDISTVFEEESSVGGEEQEQEESQRTDSDREKEPKDLGSHRHGHTQAYAGSGSSSRNNNMNAHNRHQGHLSQSSSAPSLAPSHTLPTRRTRQGTISSVTSTGAKSTKSIHPFASAAQRSTSPPPPPSSSTLHVPDARSGGLPYSRSQPNLAERYKAEQNAMHQPHQVTLVSEEDARDEGDNCPVCCESLSFTYRLPGEKPHIVPECGHSLHEECFVTVYGEVPPEGSRRHLGVCGVCRQQMKLGGGGEQRKGGNKGKLAMLMGQSGDQGSSSKFAAPSIRSISGHSIVSGQQSLDPLADDPLESASGLGLGIGASSSSRSLASDMAPTTKVIVPAISVRSEYPSIARSRKGGKQLVTAMVTVQVPPAASRALYPARQRTAGLGSPDMSSPQLPPSPMSNNSPALEYPHTARSSQSAKASPVNQNTFSHVMVDLKNRVTDFKTSGLDNLGSIRLFDLLQVRKAELFREFHVYLFQEALICISEEQRTGLRGMFSSASSIRSGNSGSTSGTGRGVLKLKGRIYVKHIRKIIDSSRPGELSLTIVMTDDDMDSFVLTFKERGSHETWKTNLNRLIEETKGGGGPHFYTGNGTKDMSSKAAKMMGTAISIPKSASSRNFTPNSSTSHGQSVAGISSFGDLASPSTTHSFQTPATSAFSPQETANGNLAFNQPLAPTHTPIDIVICMSLPSPSLATGGNLPLKVRLMRQSLAFTLALMGPRDRISLVACELGQTGIVRKTPFLNTTRFNSRRRLEAFVESLGTAKVGEDEFEVQVGPNEKQDVVTAVNVGLDVVLQRKWKNPLTGLVLLSDTSDVIKRAQMELVTARLDAANVPVHCLGYGKSHAPSPLWMLSNHTHGTYTFVKEWYDLRDTLAGVVGGLMSIALTNMKLHLNSAENDFRITKVSGTIQAIVSHDGKNVDIELRELRHGELREILVEMELGSGNGSNGEGGEQQYSSGGSSEGETNGLSVPPGRSVRSGSRQAPSFSTRGSGNANGLGLDMLSVNDSNALRDGVYEDGLIDEVPVTEVDCSFTDPAAGRSVARLAHPVLLTLALLPPNSPPSSSQPDPTLVRRRMELLTSDMITRALLIASRKNFSHAARILRETKKIVETMSDGMRGNLHPSGHARSKREVQTIMAIGGLGNALSDVDMLLDGLEEHKELFERDHRNYAAQQAIVLKSQKSWTTRTPTERYYCTEEVQRIIQLSGEYSSRQ